MRHEADDAKTQIQLQNITDAEAEALIVRSVELFNEVRENWWQSEGREQGRVYPLCLAGIGPYGAYLANGAEYRGRYGVSKEVLRQFHARRMELLWNAGADILLIETQPSLQEALLEADLAEQLGADVSYDTALKAARIVRAGVEIIMPIGSRTCTVNGKPFTMDIAPYIENGRTMIPARYVSELFGQSIEWVPEGRIAAVTENKALAGDTNLEPWAMAMGAYLNAANNGGRPTVFGSKGRGLSYSMDAIGNHSAAGTLYTYEWARYILENSWGITDREDLIETVCRMTYYGHNADFQAYVAMIKGMSAAEYRELLNNAEGMDAYMFPYTKRLGEKWGDRGILCWDLFRMSNLVQWGYAAGYLTYPEALALLEPAATLLQKNFKNWNEAFENYLDGYNWWAKENVGTKDPWTVTRGPYVKKLMQNYSELFDNSLFKNPIRSVDGVTAEQLLASVQ